MYDNCALIYLFMFEYPFLYVRMVVVSICKSVRLCNNQCMCVQLYVSLYLYCCVYACQHVCVKDVRKHLCA